MLWRLAHDRTLDLSRPAIMAILNLTPDSFADGGTLGSIDDALARAGQAINEGAAILDLGGESTRPGAARVDEATQLARVLPVLGALRARRDFDAIPLSIDTTLPGVARACLEAGADAVNDVSGGAEGGPALLELVRAHRAGLVLMHRVVEPPRDVYSDQYAAPPMAGDVVEQVRAFLDAAMARAIAAGIDADRLLLDPGLGFGKTVPQNLDLIRGTDRLRSLGRPILSGLSRKSFVGRWGLGRDSHPSERLAATLALSKEHVAAGAKLLRVHDVREHAALLREISP